MKKNFNIGDECYYLNKHCVIMALFENKAVIRFYAEVFCEDEGCEECIDCAEFDIAVSTKELTKHKIDVTETVKKDIAMLNEEFKVKKKELKDITHKINKLKSENSDLLKFIQDNQKVVGLARFLHCFNKYYAAVYSDNYDLGSSYRILEVSSDYFKKKHKAITISVDCHGEVFLGCDGEKLIFDTSKENVVKKLREYILAKKTEKLNEADIRFAKEHKMEDLILRKEIYDTKNSIKATKNNLGNYTRYISNEADKLCKYEKQLKNLVNGTTEERDS